MGLRVGSEGGRETCEGICEGVVGKKMRVAEMSEFIAGGEDLGEEESEEGGMKGTVRGDVEVEGPTRDGVERAMTEKTGNGEGIAKDGESGLDESDEGLNLVGTGVIGGVEALFSGLARM